VRFASTIILLSWIVGSIVSTAYLASKTIIDLSAGKVNDGLIVAKRKGAGVAAGASSSFCYSV